MNGLALDAVRPWRDGFEMVFRGGELRPWPISVLVYRVGGRAIYEFPHVLSDTGETLGSDEADAAVREHARELGVTLDAASAWPSWTESR